MTDLEKFQRACRVFLARLLMFTARTHLTCCGAWRTSWSGLRRSERPSWMARTWTRGTDTDSSGISVRFLKAAQRVRSWSGGHWAECAMAV